MSTAFLPLLENSTKTHKGFSGTIVNISSISGHIRISQGHFAYNSSKGATIHLNKMLAAEIAKNGIKGKAAPTPANAYRITPTLTIGVQTFANSPSL
jgi:NAD(P)-dependent dehydrogenase (short-subunit alcohol dehydrogenase family)